MRFDHMTREELIDYLRVKGNTASNRAKSLIKQYGEEATSKSHALRLAGMSLLKPSPDKDMFRASPTDTIQELSRKASVAERFLESKSSTVTGIKSLEHQRQMTLSRNIALQDEDMLTTMYGTRHDRKKQTKKQKRANQRLIGRLRRDVDWDGLWDEYKQRQAYMDTSYIDPSDMVQDLMLTIASDDYEPDDSWLRGYVRSKSKSSAPASSYDPDFDIPWLTPTTPLTSRMPLFTKPTNTNRPDKNTSKRKLARRKKAQRR